MVKRGEDGYNQLVRVLLMITLFLVIIGTLFSIIKLNDLEERYIIITGASGANVTEQKGNVSLNLLSKVQITLYGNINWSAGQVNGSYTTGHDFCKLIAGTNISANLSGSNRDFNTSWAVGVNSGFHNATRSEECVSFVDQTAFSLTNTGNVDITNVTVNSDLGSLGWGETFNSSTENGTYKFNIVEITDNACTTTHASAGTWVSFINDTNQQICTNFESAGIEDTIAIEVEVTLPEDAPLNTWLDTLTFTGTLY